TRQRVRQRGLDRLWKCGWGGCRNVRGTLRLGRGRTGGGTVRLRPSTVYLDMCRNESTSRVSSGEGSASQGECNAVGGVGVKVSARSGETDWATAHRRLGHVAMPSLKQLEKDGAVKGLKLNGQPPDDNCEICLLSKFTRFPFHSVTGRSKRHLELVHMDLVGPLPVQRHKGERYFLTIVDDWSRLMWAYALKQKDHAASTIKEDWLPFVEKQAECVVKRIKTDRGGEFLGAETTAWLKKQGIQRELTTAYSPQSNGVAERANRTILETARALLIESGVGNSMWPHAVRHATVARNRVLTKVGNESWVPLERWLGRKPPVDMLRVFGSMAVAHVPKKYRKEEVYMNGTWDLVVLPEGKKAVQCKWVLRIKTDDKGQVTIYKSRLVAKGFMQKEKQDFNEIFAPTAKPPTLRVLLADAAVSGKSIIQMDISTAFLNGILEEDVYMTQPPGYEDGTGRGCKLKKSIYGLKQAPRCWYQKLAAVLEEMGFRTSSCDESLFLKGEGEKLVLFLVYVDDILLFSSSMKEIQNVQQQLMKNFKCKTLGEVKYYLGMHVERDLDHRWLKLHQEKFIKELGENYGIENERNVATPLPAEFKLVKAAEDEGVEAEEQQQFQSLVGSLLYTAVYTRPDISFSVGQLASVSVMA
ncbi:unnamed protein product, partial [Closterium sp. NIES-54]